MPETNVVYIPALRSVLAVEFICDAVAGVRFCAATSLPGVNLKKHQPASLGQQAVVDDLLRYFAGFEVSFDSYQVDLGKLPEFSRQVLEATRRIPYGERTSYGAIAQLVGRPKAARAVGQALHRNPVPIIIPCHRVVGSGGDLRGFGGGIDLKARLLALEAQTNI